MTTPHHPIGQTALVIGGSISGLLAARVLSDFYVEVVILERDSLPTAAEPRKGVPQGRHAHALLAKGREILEELFPGLVQHLVNLGAPRGRGRFFSGGGYLSRIPNGPLSLFVSRPCLETEVRARLLARPNVRVIAQCDVLGLMADESRGRVSGVHVRRRDTGTAEETLPADLVVDASGRGSRISAWLDTLGYAKPDVELVEVGMAYVTRFYRRTPDHINGDLMVNVAPTRHNKRACGMMAQEGDRWIVTLAGYFGDHPPTDEQGFLEFARSLAAPEVYDVIRVAEPLTELMAYTFPANQRRHYEKLSRFPEGLLVIGDAIASFTPIYGQGMTVAALEALALRECLARGGVRQLAQRFFKQAGKAVDIAWTITVGNDLRLSDSYQPTTQLARFLNWYLPRVQIAARRDPVVAFAFMKVGNLIAAPPSLLHPAIALRVWWGNLRQPRATTPSRSAAPSFIKG